MTNIAELLPHSTQKALVSPRGEFVRFNEFREQVQRLAGGLHQQGLREGDRVLVLLPMGIDLYRCLLAIFHLGATAVLVDPAASLAEKIAQVKPNALIGIPKAHLLRLKVPALRGLRHYYSLGFTLLPHRNIRSIDGPSRPPASPQFPALITFTTGTTGTPKCMARSHSLLVAQHHALRCHMDLNPTDVDLPTLPVFLLHSLACGATCVIPDANLRHPGDVEAAPIVEQIIREGVTTSSGSPAFFQRLQQYLQATGTTLPSIQRVFLGGARVPSSLLRSMASTFPNAAFQLVYGSTEAEPIAVLDGQRHLDSLEAGEKSGKGILVGTPVQATQVQIRNQEICVTGDHVNPAYLNDEAATNLYKYRAQDAQGQERIWHRTGDAGFIDEQGQIWLLGRIGQDVAGHWPFPVETQVERLAFVQRAGLIERDGRPILAVELHEPPTDWTERIHSLFDIPIVQVDRIPLDPRHQAKIDRAVLRNMIEPFFISERDALK